MNVYIILSIILLFIGIIFYFISQSNKESYLQNDPVLLKLREKMVKVFPEEMSKINLYTGDKSYTINKKKIYMCMKDERGDYYNDQILSNVFLHELAHTLCPEVGHTDLFYSIFDDLLEKASDGGIYDINTTVPSDYCMY